jgi:phosphate ABC transporter phosphate-binding protein
MLSHRGPGTDAAGRSRRIQLCFAVGAILGALLAPPAAPALDTGGAQSIRTVFVAPAGSGEPAEQVRARLIERLKKSKAVRIVYDQKSADATLHSKIELWSTGRVSPNPRSNSILLTNYQGYLSTELTDRSDQTLWSYLATPDRFHLSNIVDDLADQISAKLIATLTAGISASAASPAGNVGGSVSLRAAGATFPAPLYQKWFESFAEEPGGFRIAYDAVGSVAGLQQLAQAKVDMAASDIPADAGAAADQAGLEYFPTIVGGVAPIYNLPGFNRVLNLTPAVLADIYSGRIQRWNDARIQESNKSVRLPAAEIVVVHRADGSGTTYAWTSFLATASADWKKRVGASVEWPVGEGASGNDGVAERVSKTPYSIGYVEFTYAIQHQLSYAAVRNPAGRFIRADLDSITAAASSPDGADASLLNSAPANAYPIATFTYLVIPEADHDAQRRAATARFLHWMLTSGQKQCSALGYAPLPRETVAAELRKADALK